MRLETLEENDLKVAETLATRAAIWPVPGGGVLAEDRLNPFEWWAIEEDEERARRTLTGVIALGLSRARGKGGGR